MEVAPQDKEGLLSAAASTAADDGDDGAHVSWLGTAQQRYRAKMWAAAVVVVVSVVLGAAAPPEDKGVKAPWAQVSAIVGWLYFFAWSISFYPQIYLNYVRRSVVGLSLDYVSLNIIGVVVVVRCCRLSSRVPLLGLRVSEHHRCGARGCRCAVLSVVVSRPSQHCCLFV